MTSAITSPKTPSTSATSTPPSSQLGIDHHRLTYPFRGLDQKLVGVEPAKIIAKALA